MRTWKRALALLLALALLAGCAPAEAGEDPVEIEKIDESAVTPGGDGPALTAASMYLRRIQGSVNVADGDGKMVHPRDDLGLYSDYRVATRRESYAWIDLDSVKLTKMDQESEIAIQKEDRDLAVEVRRGSLFFHVTEPLADGESMEIRASTMLVGIRGTCGWVEVPDEGRMDVYLLEGTAEVSVTDSQGRVTTAQIRGGEAAHITAESGGDGATIALDVFTAAQVPDFAMEEVRGDAALCEKIEAESGLALYQFDPETAVLAALSGIAYVGDAAACRMSAAQAAAFAQVLEDRMAAAAAAFEGLPAEYGVSRLRCFAALADAGDGIPILLYGPCAEAGSAGYTVLWDIALAVDPSAVSDIQRLEVWQWQDGRAVRAQAADFPPVTAASVYPGRLALGARGGFPPDLTSWVYPLSGGCVAASYTTQARARGVWNDAAETYSYDYTVDGAAASLEAYTAWHVQWAPDDAPLTFSGSDRASGDAGVEYTGFSDAADVLNALRGGVAPAERGRGARNVSTYDPATHIRHTVADTGTPMAEVYSEIPVFEETSDAYRAVNRFFQELEDEFLASALSEMARFTVEYPGSYGEVYSSTWDAAILCHTDRLLCVRRDAYYFAGGAHPGGDTKYDTFDLRTGELLTLSAAADAGSDEIAAYILQELERLNQERGTLWMDEFRNRGADDYKFYVENGKIYAAFALYEGASYADGVLPPIELPFGLRSELQ